MTRDQIITELQNYRENWNHAGFEHYGELICDVNAGLIDAAVETLKAQEPRILTADEMKSWDKDVWIEDFDEDRVVALDESVAGFAVACMRGKKRCWTARPTEEQRKAVAWT